MSISTNEKLMKLISDALERLELGAKSVIETKDYKVKAYYVNSSAKYAHSSLRIDIQDLEPRDYT